MMTPAMTAQQIIVRACFERGHSNLFAERGGHNDAGNIRGGFLKERQDHRGIEPRQRVIRNDQIPTLAGECGRHLAARFHPFVSGLVAPLAQFDQEPFGILIRRRDN